MSRRRLPSISAANDVSSAVPRYLELPPSPPLAPWIECYWSIQADDTPPVPNRVLPDGCADLIVGIPGVMGVAVVGTMRTAAVVPVVGRVDLFGIRFRPGAAAAFLGVPLGELTGQRVPLDALWGARARRATDLHEPAPLETRVRAAESMLLALPSRERAGDLDLACRAVALLRQARGGAGIRETAAALGVGERRLQRAFDHMVGIGPKALARVLRFRRAVRLIGRAPVGRTPVGWAALAAEAGYADQPHMIREFRALAGLTPAAWAAELRAVGFVQYGSGAGPHLGVASRHATTSTGARR